MYPNLKNGIIATSILSSFISSTNIPIPDERELLQIPNSVNQNRNNVLSSLSKKYDETDIKLQTQINKIISKANSFKGKELEKEASIFEDDFVLNDEEYFVGKPTITYTIKVKVKSVSKFKPTLFDKELLEL
ncbi:hypothetical protein IT568_02615 [bacterium]|nr:hypothetical protein [bacterium]